VQCLEKRYGIRIMDMNVIDGIAVPYKSSALILNLVSQFKCLFKVLANSAGRVSHSLEGGGGCSKESRRLER